MYHFHRSQASDVCIPTEKASPRQLRGLDYISQFSTDIRHISGEENVIADTLSRIEAIDSKMFDFEDLANAQEEDVEIKHILGRNSTSLQLKSVTLPQTSNLVFCDVSTDRIRPFVTKSLRQRVFKMLHILENVQPRKSSQNISYGQK